MDAVRRVSVVRVGAAGAPEDDVAVEEPLEIRLSGDPLAVVMRTPGHDPELAAGFLLTEGILPSQDALGAIAHCRAPDAGLLENVVNAIPSEGVQIARPRERRFDATAACGLCGKDRIEDIRVRAAPVPDGFTVTPARLAEFVPQLAANQPLFARTGGLHGAALFDAAGRLVVAREDIGRHNAVDKIVGYAALRELLPLSRHVLVVSGRVGFEIAQKAAVAGIPVLAGVSAPSSLAVELAIELRVTLIAFLRGDRFNVYAHAQRIR